MTPHRDTVIHQHEIHCVLADAQIITLHDGSTITLHRVLRKGHLSPLLRAIVQSHSVAVVDLRALHCAPPDGHPDPAAWISATMQQLYQGEALVRRKALSNLVDLWINPSNRFAKEAA